MHQPVHAGRQLDECAEISEARHLALHAISHMELLAGHRPGIGHELFHAKRDPASCRCYFQDFYFDGVSDRDCVGWFRDAMPSHVGDVQQTVDAGSKLDESPKIGEAAGSAANDVSFMKFG